MTPFSWFLLALFAIWGVERVLVNIVKGHTKVRLASHRTRRIEALAQMDDAARQRLIESMPEWLDPEDPDDVEGWRQARSETLQSTRGD